MRENLHLPDLTFPDVKLGIAQTPWNLNRWLYRGGAALRLDKVAEAISSGRLGRPLLERIELVQKIHSVLCGQLASGGSKFSASTRIDSMNALVLWADENHRPLTVAEIQTTYIHWTDALNQRVKVRKDMLNATAYHYASLVGTFLDCVLCRARPMILLTRIRRGKTRKTPLGAQADKQNLEWTFAFGHLLQDICDGLPLEVLWGPLPARIPLRSGGELEHWSKAHAKEWRKTMLDNYAADRTLETRWPLANLRIEAELLMFIGQTGMNLAQAHQLALRHFSYSSDVDSYKVREYKARRGGEVLFTIYKEYRAHFERYLAWRRSVFPGNTPLFPLVRLPGRERSADVAPRFTSIRKYCEQIGVRFVPPQMLRNTRVNWVLRRTGDPDLTAEMAQHGKEVLLGVYVRPSLQRAVGEICRYWQKNDPTLTRVIPLHPVAPGECDGEPKAMLFKPKEAPLPDCVRPSGCLWCEHHRDVDSLDYVWALACFRHLKIIEVSIYHPPQGASAKHPGEYAIERMSQKLTWFHDSNAKRHGWVEEALSRVDEGNYHPEWARLIRDMEGGHEHQA